MQRIEANRYAGRKALPVPHREPGGQRCHVPGRPVAVPAAHSQGVLARDAVQVGDYRGEPGGCRTIGQASHPGAQCRPEVAVDETDRSDLTDVGHRRHRGVQCSALEPGAPALDRQW